MSTTPKNVSDDQEIDLSQISKKIGQGFQNIGAFIFNCIQFFFKNAIVIVLLFIVGVGLGYLLDSNKKTYDHQIIVIPNFNSTDYLYSKIELINSKIKERDTVFLKDLGFKNPKSISKIEIEPIIDPYNFVRDRTENFDLVKLMSEDGNTEKVLKDRMTSKNYMYHTISFSTKGKATDANTIQPLLASLNDNAYLKIIQKNVLENVKLKMQYNEQTLNQINALLDRFSSEGSKSNNLVYYNENTEVDEVLKTKDELIREQGNRRIELVNYDNIVKDISIISNIEKSSSSKFVFPLIFIFIFIFGRIFFSFYKKQALRHKEKASNQLL